RDAPGIAHVHVQAWREAYARQLPAEVLDALQEEPRAKRWAAITEDELTDVYVAEVGRRIVGWASAGDGREEEAPVSRELHGIYVLRDVYGTGAGQQLLDAAIGREPAYLWMLHDNPRAEAFYRKNLFEADGTGRDGHMSGYPV